MTVLAAIDYARVGEQIQRCRSQHLLVKPGRGLHQLFHHPDDLAIAAWDQCEIIRVYKSSSPRATRHDVYQSHGRAPRRDSTFRVVASALELATTGVPIRVRIAVLSLET